MKKRCEWCGSNPQYIAYHDDEWGIPVHNDRLLFEFLILEGAQAGLSWLTILKKRENYRKAFHAFDCERIAKYTEADVTRLLSDSDIVRNQLKIESSIIMTLSFMALLVIPEIKLSDRGLFDGTRFEFMEFFV